MTRTEQKQLATEVLRNLTVLVNERLHRIPEEWDGIEIKKWIGDLYADQFTSVVTRILKEQKSRKRSYENALLEKNLA